jgi:phosphatidate cytidylyltransferase
MLLRWISAVIGIALFLGLCFWGPVPFTIGVVVLAALGLGELLKTYWAQGLRPNPVLALMGPAGPALLLYISPWMWGFDYYVQRAMLPALCGGLILGLVWEVARAARTGEMRAAQNVGYGLLCGSYVALFGGMAFLRFRPGPVNAGTFPDMDAGAAYLLLTVFCVWATDSFALFVGKAFGKHKLAPKLSPGKTVEGTVGGLIAALLTGALFGWVFFRNPAYGIGIGAVAGVFAQVGDLFESALKREAGIKDFGGIMPGHGGILDRFDSLLFVSPLASLLFCLAGSPVR